MSTSLLQISNNKEEPPPSESSNTNYNIDDLLHSFKTVVNQGLKLIVCFNPYVHDSLDGFKEYSYKWPRLTQLLIQFRSASTIEEQRRIRNNAEQLFEDAILVTMEKIISNINPCQYDGMINEFDMIMEGSGGILIQSRLELYKRLTADFAKHCCNDRDN